MNIDGRIHALKILELAMGKRTDIEINELLKAALEKDSCGNNRVNEEKLWKDIILMNNDSNNFIKSRKINSCDELVQYHFEWKMKYLWRIYSNVSSSIDYEPDSFEDTDFLD